MDNDRLVFLCHSSGDKEKVRRLYRDFKREQIACWFDEEDLLPGQDWDLEITRALRASTYVVVCLSKASITRAGYVQKELRRALHFAEEQPEGSIYLIPARLEQCEMPERLRKLQRVDLFAAGGYERLVKLLGGPGGRFSIIEASSPDRPTLFASCGPKESFCSVVTSSVLAESLDVRGVASRGIDPVFSPSLSSRQVSRELKIGDVLLALIGPGSTGTENDIERKIEENVRIDFEKALHYDIHVQPVLIDGAVLPHVSRLPVGFQNSVAAADLRFQAARWYSLIRPPRIGRRLICRSSRSGSG